MHRALAVLLLIAAASASAAPPPETQREVAQLFTALETSGCRFQRNGSWYSGAQARQHLQRKYDYVRKRDAASSTERFIELAATRSSRSGRAYRVQCPGRPAVDSATWFRGVLAKVRAGG